MPERWTCKAPSAWPPVPESDNALAKRKAPRTRRAGIYTTLAGMKRKTGVLRRGQAYTTMARTLIEVGAKDWRSAKLDFEGRSDPQPLQSTKRGLSLAEWQSGQMSLKAWSREAATTARARFVQKFEEKKLRPGAKKKRTYWRKLKADGTPGARISGKKADALVNRVAYHARVKLVQSMLGGTYAEARRSLRDDADGWEGYLQKTREDYPIEEDGEELPEERTLKEQAVAAAFRY